MMEKAAAAPTLLLHRQQPTRLPRPRDSPGKNAGVGCHFLLQCMKVKSESEVVQLCLTLSDLMDCSPPGSSVHGIFQAAIAFSVMEKEEIIIGLKSLKRQEVIVSITKMEGRPESSRDPSFTEKGGAQEWVWGSVGLGDSTLGG